MIGSAALLSMHSCPVAPPGSRDVGGMNVYLIEIARRLGRRGLRTDVFTRCHGHAHPDVMGIGERARAIHLPAGRPDATKAELAAAAGQFAAGIEAFAATEGERYDLVHSHYWLSGLAGIRLSRSLGIPHVATFHTLARLKLRARPGEIEPSGRIVGETDVIRSADGIVVSTHAEAGEMMRLYGEGRGRVAVIPPGVDTAVFSPRDRAESRRRLGIREPHVVLYVGRLDPLKGLDILVGAVARTSMAGETRLLVVGGGPDSVAVAAWMKRLAADEGMGDRVTFAGAVPQDDLAWYYGAADALVLPSHYESFGMAALEAMACGRPVVASRVGGLGSFVVSGRNGYLVPWRCADPFAQRIEMVLASPSLRRALGDAALASAQAMGWDRTCRSLAEFYGSIVGGTAAMVGAGGA